MISNEQGELQFKSHQCWRQILWTENVTNIAIINKEL